MENTQVWKTSISKVEPDCIQLRGYKIEELMDSLSFTDISFLAIFGKKPSLSESRLFQAIINSSVDHGVTPPSTLATLNATSTGAPINVAVASGILSINKFHGGAIEGCMNILYELNKKFLETKGTLETFIEEKYLEMRAKKIVIPGFGHRVHKNDPRALKLFSIMEEENLSGNYLKIINLIRTLIHKHTGNDLPVNVDGAIAGALCELGADSRISNGLFIISRVPGLVAHYFEEETREKKMRKIIPGTEIYDGAENLKL